MAEPDEATPDILLVEDQPVARRVIREVLQNGGWSVVEADDAPEAIRAMNQAPCKLIILDYRLPGMDGLMLLREFRRLGFAAPVIVVSGHLSADMTQAFRNDGVEKIFRKTDFRGDALVDAVRQLMPPPEES